MTSDNINNINTTTIEEEKITLIMGQTCYTLEESEKLLKIHNNDEIAVIREYLGSKHNESIESKSNPVIKSKNQLIYKEIREFMDGCKK